MFPNNFVVSRKQVRQAMLQLYALKLLKMQTKYLGRQWRKTNMKAMSAIYHKVRHRLGDDWAYGSDLDARPWDFQVCTYFNIPIIPLHVYRNILRSDFSCSIVWK